MSTTAAKQTGPELAEIAPGRKRLELLLAVAETLKLTGHTNIRARLSGYRTTPTIEGTIESHRPDLLCLQPDKKHTPTLVDVITRAELEDQGALLGRLSLFADMRRTRGCEVQLVVPNASLRAKDDPVGNPADTYEARVRRLCAQIDFIPNKVWSV